MSVEGESEAEAITQPGDLIELGPHQLLCGDATVEANVGRVLGDDLGKARMCLTDPPYGVDYDAKNRPGAKAEAPTSTEPTSEAPQLPGGEAVAVGE